MSKRRKKSNYKPNSTPVKVNEETAENIENAEQASADVSDKELMEKTDSEKTGQDEAVSESVNPDSTSGDNSEKSTDSEETAKTEDESADKKSTKKSKKRLGVIFLKEDEEAGLEKKLVEPDKVQKITELVIAVFVAVAMVAIMFCIRFVALDRTVRKLNTVIEDMSSQTVELTRENAELSEKVSLLSNQVAVQMVADEETEAKKIPNGLPISGKVVVISEPENQNDALNQEENAEEKEPVVIFGVEDGSKVMASGAGEVTFVGYDEEFVYRVEIDHGNGYTSVYRYAGEPKVKEGDEVLRAQLLFEVSGGGSVVGYQIIKDEEFVDPMTVMEING